MNDRVDVGDRAHELRRLVLELALAAGTTHIASALSIADILAVLYLDGSGRLEARADGSPGDRLLLSKGHAASALYAALALAGVLDRDDLLAGYCRDGGRYAGHSERAVPGVEISSGSLGHGLAIAAGLALADRHARNCNSHALPNARARRTFCLLGDGELNEGSIWEAAALAGHLRLANLTAIVDANGMQGLGLTDDVVAQGPLRLRFEPLGWEVVEVDGHDTDALARAFDAPAAAGPRCIVARTVKGKGVGFLEGDWRAHYASFRPGDRERVLEALAAGRRAA